MGALALHDLFAGSNRIVGRRLDAHLPGAGGQVVEMKGALGIGRGFKPDRGLAFHAVDRDQNSGER